MKNTIDPVPATPVEISRAGHYLLPTAELYIGIVASGDTAPQRLRFHLGDARVLDLPLTPECLAQLQAKILRKPSLDAR